MLLDFYTRLRRRRLITGSTYNLPLTQVQMGSYLGLTVVHINRVLKSLRNDQIAQMEKHCVSILDLDRLRALAQCEAVPVFKPHLSETALTNSEAAHLA